MIAKIKSIDSNKERFTIPTNWLINPYPAIEYLIKSNLIESPLVP
jgi:hypothetical protein